MNIIEMSGRYPRDVPNHARKDAAVLNVHNPEADRVVRDSDFCRTKIDNVRAVIRYWKPE